MSETFYSKLFSPNKTIFCLFLIPMLWELCRIKNESGERLSPWNMFLLILSSTETYLFADNSGLSLLMLSKTKQVMLSDKRYIFSHYLIYHGKLNLKFPFFLSMQQYSLLFSIYCLATLSTILSITLDKNKVFH